jgi:hypothetical protein
MNKLVLLVFSFSLLISGCNKCPDGYECTPKGSPGAGGTYPGGGNGVPWMACPANLPTDCGAEAWSASPRSTEPYLTNVGCKGNWCRANIVNAKMQCPNGAKVTCPDGTHQSTCVSGSWEPCP